jgi:hypothetical protein
VTLLSLEDADGTGATFAAGSDIQRVCAVEHGRQRAHLGWDEVHVEREYQILAEEVERRLRDQAAEHGPAWDNAIAAVRARLEQAKTHSLGALHSV